MALQSSVTMHQRVSGYEVRAVVGFGREDFANQEESVRQLKKLYAKLEQIIPGTHSVKFNMTKDEIILTVKADKSGEAYALLHKFNEYIKSAAMALKV